MFFVYIDRTTAKVLIAIIRRYQRWFSFDHSPLKEFYPFGYCRFRPTCSEYTCQALERYGAIKGLLKSSWRILRCNPFNPGGWDPVK